METKTIAISFDASGLDEIKALVERMEAAADRIEKSLGPNVIEFHGAELDGATIDAISKALSDYERKFGRIGD